jgi:hypothetical protein
MWLWAYWAGLRVSTTITFRGPLIRDLSACGVMRGTSARDVGNLRPSTAGGRAVAVAVGGSEVAVGGTGVAVGGSDVAVGGTGVAVGASGVAVGGTGVAVGASGVTVGGTGVALAAGDGAGREHAARNRAASSSPEKRKILSMVIVWLVLVQQVGLQTETSFTQRTSWSG